MDKLDENWEEANWTETAGGGKLGENHGWTRASGKKLRAVKWNVGELAMNCPASDSRIQGVQIIMERRFCSITRNLQGQTGVKDGSWSSVSLDSNEPC